MSHRFRKFGFTLIELLIVVAIIAILAAIAVPNFLEAQTRSKVSRARADMRTVATALESYFVDTNRYPMPHGNTPFRIPGSQRFDGYGQPRGVSFSTLPPDITTPIAYLTSPPLDVFKIGKRANSGVNVGRPYTTGNPWDGTFVYHPVGVWSTITGSGFNAGDVNDYGQWRMFSIGPDGLFNPIGTSDLTRGWLYDPTNGTISSGMLIRTQVDTIGAKFTR